MMNISSEAYFASDLNDFVVYFGDGLWLWVIIPILAVLGFYLTFRLKVVQFFAIPEMFRTVVEKNNKILKDGEKKPISAFQAFSLSAASRVGVGNIAGVGTAIAVGGAGAVFWMWAMAFVGGASSFVESTLAQVYKVRDTEGFRGGPAYYMKYGLGKKWLGTVFAITLIICFPFAFSSLQANTIASSLQLSTGGELDTWVILCIAIFIATLVGLIIFGGVHRIASVSQSVVPIMAILYLLLGVLIVFLNISEVPRVFSDIFSQAFGITEFSGGALGTIIMTGIKRGMFSNEAGLGSAPNASATADVSHPVKQGLVQTLGVYFDTFLVCSITAFIILVSVDNLEGIDRGVALTHNAIGQGLGTWATYLLMVIVFMLAFTSILGNYYYGESNVEFISENKNILTGYRIFVIIAIFFGTLLPSQFIWDFADAVMGIMAFINLLVIGALSGIAIMLFKDYFAKRKLGLNPTFSRKDFPQLKGVQCWDE